MFSAAKCFRTSIASVSLTVNSDFHLCGEHTRTVFLGVDRTDIGPTVTGLDLRQLGYHPCVWLKLGLHEHSTWCRPSDFGDGIFRSNFGYQPQGAVLREGWSRNDSYWKQRRAERHMFKREKKTSRINSDGIILTEFFMLRCKTFKELTLIYLSFF